MRIWLLGFLVIGINAKLPITKQQLLAKYKQQENKVFLLSYPRSGNTWTRYCLQFLTKRPTFSHYPRGSFSKWREWINFSQKAKIGVDYSKDIIWKIHFRHYFELVGDYNPETDKLIMISRNYKECLIRHLGAKIFADNFENNLDVLSYLDNFQLFDEWPEDNRVLIYYEDLIQHPKETLKKVLLFLGENLSYLNSFIENYNKHRNNSIGFYTSNIGPSVTHGNTITYHGNKLNKEKRIEIDQKIAKMAPAIWEKYLKNMYQEQ